MTKTKVCVITLGCPKNTVDSEYLLAHLKASAIQLVDTPHKAHVLVINTCGFIQDAKQESIETILEAAQLKKEGIVQKVIVMGCLSERYREELKKEIPEVDSFFGTQNLKEVIEEVSGWYKNELLGERYLTTPKHYAYLKIAEGCNHPCSFCSIPLMRGKHCSVPREHLMIEAEKLAQQGVKELIVIAQDTTYYGLDLYGRRELPSLLKELSSIEGIEWIRLMYAYPSQFPLELLEVMKASNKICHYIDIPIQHISDSVLRSMRRGISARATKELLTTMKSEIPDIALRTTLIVGYPTETEDDFRQLYDFVGEMEFNRLGVFAYSQEEGTVAYELGDPIPAEVKQQRVEQLMMLQRDISLKKNEKLIGSTQIVLVDEIHPTYAIGRTEYDAPEIDQEVIIHYSEKLKQGQFVKVQITDAAEYDLEGKVVVH